MGADTHAANTRPAGVNGRPTPSLTTASTLELFIADGSLNGRWFQWLHAEPHARVAFAWIVMIFELSIGPALLARRTRKLAVAAAIMFHLLVELTVHPDVFGWICLVLLFSFVDDAPRAPEASPSTRASEATARRCSDRSRVGLPNSEPAAKSVTPRSRPRSPRNGRASLATPSSPACVLLVPELRPRAPKPLDK
ncbi:MAG: HTTM domain-containing protein, partial [Polyangiales bacterium]